MRNRLLFSFTMLYLLLSVAMGHAQTANPSDALETVGQGMINWTTGEVYATGIGAPPGYPSPGIGPRHPGEWQ